MGELQPNPKGCKQFEANAFKPGICTHCRLGWREHKDVIAQELLQAFLKEAERLDNEKQHHLKELDDEKKAVAREKMAARKYDWFDDEPNDGNDAPAGAESDALGFRMLERGDLESANAGARRSIEVSARVCKQLKVVNLIDFEECDLPEERTTASAVANSDGEAAADDDPSSGGCTPCSDCDTSFPGSDARSAAVTGDLHLEIEHLQQRLASVDEERHIQVAIVRDEVAEKQRSIEELERKQAESDAARGEAEAMLARALERVKSLELQQDAARDRQFGTVGDERLTLEAGVGVELTKPLRQEVALDQSQILGMALVGLEMTPAQSQMDTELGPEHLQFSSVGGSKESMLSRLFHVGSWLTCRSAD